MARRKLSPFTADDASDAFIPTVKTIKGADIDDSIKEKKITGKKKKRYKVPKVLKTEIEKDEVEEKVVENIQYPMDMEKSIIENVEKPIHEKERKLKEEKGKEEESGDTMVELVGFVIGEEEFGVDIQKVQEINRMIEITGVPRAPEFIEGVINLRGKVIPVISLRKRFGLTEKENDNRTRIVVVEIENAIVGFIVDSVTEVLRIPSSTIEPPPDIVSGIDAEYIVGVGKLEDRLLILLALDKILSKGKIEQLKQVA